MISDVDLQKERSKMFLFVDITKVKEREKEKLETKFKNIFLSSVSHNLKTPLNSK